MSTIAAIAASQHDAAADGGRLPRLADLTPSRAGRISPIVLAGTVRAVDLGTISALGLAIALLWVDAPLALAVAYAIASTGTALAAVLLFQLMGLYRPSSFQHLTRAVPRLVAAWLLAVAGLVACLFLAKVGTEFSRVWLLAWLVTAVTVLVAGRAALAALARHWARVGRLSRRAVVYGSGPACQALLLALEQHAANEIRICGIFDDRNPDRAGNDVAGYPTRGRLDDLVAFARQSRVDLVLLALPVSAEARLVELLGRLWVLPVDIRLAASASRLRLSRHAYSYLGNVALIDLADKPIADWGVVAKWLFDKVIGALALILLSPVMLATAIAIRLDSRGPVLFRQKRYGFNNELIEVFKFRSMYVDQSDARADRLVTRDDPRVTRVGRFIRRTSLDELPQLFNVVLKGNLSLVGPRPHAVAAKAGGKLYDEAVASYFARHKVKPGITGWAQINGWRGETDTQAKLERRVEHDLYYIENWSLFLDAWILIRTPLALLKAEGAY